jgi:predicted phosphate transport protein (TIGR00153 family)
VRMTPRNTRFYDLFATAASHLVEATEVLIRLVDAAPAERVALAAQLKDLEHAGDQSTHEIMSALNTSFITPFDREDIAMLAGRLDDVLDDIEAAAELTVLYKIDTLPAGVRRQAELLDESARLTAPAMAGLKTLQRLSDFWIGMNDLENQADSVYRTLLAELFDSGTDAVTIIKVKEVVDQLESAADAFERVANVVQSIAAKES